MASPKQRFALEGSLASTLLILGSAPVWAQSAPVDPQLAQTPPPRQTVETITVEGQRPSGPPLSSSGSNQYSIDSTDILALPAGASTTITDVLIQMPGVALDQNQQIHIRNTEGPQFQYQINGILVPLDINTNPPFISSINPNFVSTLDLMDGILP